MITEETKQKIYDAIKVIDILKDFETLTKYGKDHYCKCPECGADGKRKGLTISESKNIAKCFSCDYVFKPVDYLMNKQNHSYIEAMKYLAGKYFIDVDEVKKDSRRTKSKSELKKPWLEEVLDASGLSIQDIMAEVPSEKGGYKMIQLLESGTIDEYNNVVKGDDIIINYYNLHGERITYKPKENAKSKLLWRVRWQNPSAHPLKNGKISKYKSPAGSGSHLFIPDQVRRAYKNGAVITNLFVDEGEKKAIKSSKEGMMSVGIMGIHNFVQNKQLPHELQLIVQKCSVRRITFRLDSDCFDLSSDLMYGDAVDYRPQTFYSAVIKFRDYVKTLYSLGLTVDIFFGYIKKNERNEKGIDDILAGSMRGKEIEFVRDTLTAIESNGQGRYCEFHNVTSISAIKLRDLWALNNPEAFAKKYHDILKDIPEFRIGKIMYRFANGKLELAQPLMPEEMFWEEKEIKGFKTYNFRYTRAMTFLQNRGFFRFMPAAGKFNWVNIDRKVVRNVEPWEIRDFVMATAKGINNEDIQDMLMKGGPQYLGPEKLSNLDFTNPEFERSGKDFQLLFFKESYWRINADEIQEFQISNLENHVWYDNIIHYKSTIINEPLIKIIPVDSFIENLTGREKAAYNKFSGGYIVKTTSRGEKSQFLQYLRNVSNFYHEKDENALTVEERMENYQHFLSKLWAFGYLLHTHFIRSKARAIIGMDGKLSALGESQGGTGKSIYGFALSYIIPQFYLDATKKEISEDKFLWDGLTEKHDSVFIDDVRTNFDFKILFNSIEGRWEVQNKGERKFRIPEALTAKIYLTTNNAINGEGNSYTRRQFNIAFSDYYNPDRTPADEFGGDLFNDWSSEQWNLFYNLAAACLQIYFKYPTLHAPDKQVQLRRLRQFMGEDFIYWAEEFFSFDEETQLGVNVNKTIPRKEVVDSFYDAQPKERRFTNPTKFKKKLKSYCVYKDLSFNPVQGGGDDKRGGIEYFTIATSNFIK